MPSGISVLILLSLLSTSAYSQKTPWQLRFGYERLWVKPEYTDYIAQNHWTWVLPNRGEVFSFRTLQPWALSAGIRYDLFSWLTFFMDYKNYFRKYYIESGFYVKTKYSDGFEGGQLQIIKLINYNIGWYEIYDIDPLYTLRTESLQFGIELSHPLPYRNQWRLHYYLSVNRDRYEVNLPLFDKITYIGNGLRLFDDPMLKKKIRAYYLGSLSLKGYDPNFMYQFSSNTGIALSYNWPNGYGLRFDLGFRNIYFFYKEREFLLRENHWQINLQYIETVEESNQIRYQATAQYNFRLDIGGPYASISLTSRPFRSKRDNPNYQPPCKRLRKMLLHHIRKILHPSSNPPQQSSQS